MDDLVAEGDLRQRTQRLRGDEASGAACGDDPLVHHGDPTIALALALVDQMDRLRARHPELRLPLLVQHGTDARICDPVGSRALAESVGTADLTVAWYEGFWHEPYHEPERERPLADLREWLDARR